MNFVKWAALALVLQFSDGAAAKPTKAALTFNDYSNGLLNALLKGTKAKEVDHYDPPEAVKPRHRVHVLALEEGKSFWYVTDGFGLVRQPGSAAGGKEVFVELATYSDRRDARIAEVLSLLGEAMHTHPARGPWNAWNYDTLTLPDDVHGLCYFVLRPGAEIKMPRSDEREQLVSVFTVIPLTAEERAQVANAGREKARAWVEKRAVEEPAAMLARWKFTAP